MTYEESATLMQNIPFRNRIKVSCLIFANLIMIEASTEPYHNTRLKWADNTYRSPDMAAQQLQPTVTMDPAVTSSTIDPATGDSSISDAALQPAVELAVVKLL